MPAYQAGAARVSSTVTKRNPRPRKYASASERQAAYRARAPEVCFRAEAKTVETLDQIAETLDQPRADVLLSMTKFALANHDWARFGLTHKPLPYGYGLAEQEFIGPRLSNPSAYSDPALWEHSKQMAVERLGGHSARAMQLAGKIYRAAGGKYLGKRTKAQKSLEQWTAQDWTTKSGKPSRETGERYLPREVIEELTPAEYGATTRAKRKGTAAGQQFVKQPKRIAAKVAALKANPSMPTLYTVKSEYLIADAERIERDAKQSLNAWILLGQSEKYSEAMKTANMLRQAAGTKNMTTRREILRNAGFTVKTPKQVTSSLEGEPRKENPTMKKPTPAQLAARARFAEMARSGAFKRKAKRNPAKKTVSEKISQLTREGYPQKQAVAIALEEQRRGKVKATPRKRNPIGDLENLQNRYNKVLITLDDLRQEQKRRKAGLPNEIEGFTNAEIKKLIGIYQSRASDLREAINLYQSNPATGQKKSRTKLNPKPRMAKIAWLTPGGQREVMEVPIDFAFKEYIGNIQEDFFARTDDGFLVVTEKSTGMRVGQVPHTMRAAALNDKAAAKRFVQSIAEKVGAPAFRAAIAKHPRIA